MEWAQILAINRKNTCFFLLPPSVLTLMTLTGTTSSVHKLYSVSITPFNTDLQTSSHHWTILYISSVSHHYSLRHTHTHIKLCPNPLFPVGKDLVYSSSAEEEGGAEWRSGVEQRSKRINHLRSCCLRTATRHTWVVGKLWHLPNDCRLRVYGLDHGRRPAPVNHWGLRIYKGI